MSCWLLEKGSTHVEYFTAEMQRSWNWSHNPNDALRLSRKEDAERLVKYLTGTRSDEVGSVIRVAEHIWS